MKVSLKLVKRALNHYKGDRIVLERQPIEDLVAFQKDAICILERLERILEAKNPDSAQILVQHCLERINNGEKICEQK